MKKYQLLKIGASVTSCLLLAPAYALDLKLDARAASEYTTNSGRASSNEIEEWVHKPGLLFRGEHEGPRINFKADYRFQRRIYQEDFFKDENVATGSGELYVNAIPGLLDFTATNSRTESAIRSINAESPDNRQETANTQAGPTLRFRTRGKDELQVQYLYGNRVSERTENDSDSHTGVLRYVLNTSPINQLNFELVKQEVQFENPNAPDLRSNTAQIQWDSTQDAISWSFVGGYKETERDLNRDDINAAVAKLDLQWRLSADRSLFVQASRDVRDQSEVLGFGSTEFGQRLRADSDLNEVFRSNRITAGVSQKIGHTNFTLMLLSIDEDYEDVLRDTETQGVILTANRRLNRLTNLSARLRYFKQDYTDQGIDLDHYGASVLVTRKMSRRLSVAGGVYYDERDPQQSALANFGYDEWLATIRIDYKLIQ